MDDHLYLKDLLTNGQPTEVLAERFGVWRKIIRCLNVYFRDVASTQEDVFRQQTKLKNSINIPYFESSDLWDVCGINGANGVIGGVNGGGSRGILDNVKPSSSDAAAVTKDDRAGFHLTSNVDDKAVGLAMFLGQGNHSLSDVPGSLAAYHQTQATNASKAAKELIQNVIPRLEDLRRDLSIKIKEIRNLSSDFKNSVAKEQNATSKELANYVHAVNLATNSPSQLASKQDPYLLKPAFERQLQRQVEEENYLLEAYLNLQGSGKELETVVAQEIQHALATYAKLMGAEGEAQTHILAQRLLQGYSAQDPAAEWDAFIKRDANFVDANLQARKFHELTYQFQNSITAKPIRMGYLERRSKYLKSYSRAWYVLTPSFLHEFKTPDRRHEPHPVMSLSLDDCQLSEDKRSQQHHHHGSSPSTSGNSSQSHKFILTAKQNGASKGHNWVFRAESEEKLREWFGDLSRLTSVGAADRLSMLNDATSGSGTATAASPPTTAATADYPAPLPKQDAIVPAIITSPKQLEEMQRSKDMQAGDKIHQVVEPISSPVLSDTSGVTSNGEPFEEQSSFVPTEGNIAEEGTGENVKRDRGRFPSEVNLERSQQQQQQQQHPLPHDASKFLVPSEIPGGTIEDEDDRSSVFSYDLTHTAATLPEDKSFKPVAADVPIEMERKLSITQHKDEPVDQYGIGAARSPDEAFDDKQEVIAKRRNSSVASVKQRKSSLPVRRPTGSYGVDEIRPLSTAEKNQEPPLFFAKGLPVTTGGADSNTK